MAFGRKKDIKKEQTDEQNALVSKVQLLYRQAYDAKSSRHKIWDNCIKAYNGEYFKKKLPDYKVQEISNFIFSTVETILPVMVANNPNILVLPKMSADYSKSVNVQYAFDHEWKRSGMFLKLLSELKYGIMLGNGIIGLFWDAKASKNIGEITPVVISPFNFFIDPMATTLDEAEYCCYATYKNIGEVMKAYPKLAEEIKSQATGIEDEYLAYGKQNNSSTRNNVLYIEMYMQDYSVELSEEEDEEGNKYKVSKMKYPNGRRIIIAGDVLLSDGENPYNYGYPFETWQCYPIPGQFWAMGEIEMLLSPQEAICSLMNSIIENAELMGNPIWILDKNSGVEKNSLTNRKGLVVRKNPGTDVHRDVPPSIPAYIQNIIQSLKDDVEKVSGVYDVMRGEKPAGITAAAAIQALNESAQGRIKLKVQTMEDMISSLGSKWLKMIQQFWTVPRTIRIMGEEYKANKVSDLQFVEIGGKPMAFKDIDSSDVDGDFDIMVVSGSTMPVNKSAKLQTLIQLAQTTAEDGLPMVDRQTILENADLGSVQDILKRIETVMQSKANAPVSIPNIQMKFSELPPSGQAQIAQQIGIQLSPDEIEQNTIANVEMQEQLRQKQAIEQEQSNEIDHQRQIEMQNMQNANEADKMNMQHGMDMQNNIMQNTNASSLQNNASGVQSQLEGNGNNSDIINELLSMKPDDLAKLASANPEILTIIKSISEQAKSTQKGEKKNVK